jgi:hypothetical protein
MPSCFPKYEAIAQDWTVNHNLHITVNIVNWYKPSSLSHRQPLSTQPPNIIVYNTLGVKKWSI